MNLIIDFRKFYNLTDNHKFIYSVSSVNLFSGCPLQSCWIIRISPVHNIKKFDRLIKKFFCYLYKWGLSKCLKKLPKNGTKNYLAAFILNS